MAANGFLLVWADGDPDQNSGSDNALHADFKLSASGEALALYSPEGIQQHLIRFGAQQANVSQGFFPDGNTNFVAEMLEWTPCAANRIGGPSSPEIGTFAVQGSGSVTIMAQTVPGHTYLLEYKNDLADGRWHLLSTAQASTTFTVFTDSAADVPRRFYRVLLLQ